MNDLDVSVRPGLALQDEGKGRSTVNLLGVNIDVVDTEGLRGKIIAFAQQESTRSVMYVNADCMLISQKDWAYRQVLNGADLIYADGIGVVYGARLWGYSLPGRSTAADFFPDFSRSFADHGLRMYFLGGREGVARIAADRLMEKIPGLMIVGTHHGYFSEDETARIIRKINAAEPDIVVIGFGAPKQELWIRDYGEELEASVLWGVGGLFDFLSGKTPRGPQWLLDHGFEWLCRLIAEPGRLWRRYLLGNTKFIFSLLWNRFFVRGEKK